MRRMTPGRRSQEKYGLSPEQYPEFAALRGDPSDNLPGIPGLGEKTATKLIQQYGDVAVADRPRRRGQGQGRRQPARGRRRACCATASSPSWSRDVPLEVGPARPAPRASGTATRCTRSSTPCSSGCCASGCTPRCRRSSRRPTRASTSSTACSRRARCAAYLDGAAAGRAGRRCTCAARGGAGPVTPTRWASPRRRRTTASRGDAGLRRPAALDEDDDAALAAWLADRVGREGAARREGPAARAARRAAGPSPGSPATPRSPPTSRCPGRGSSTSPTWRCASCAASCAPRCADDGQLSLRRRAEAGRRRGRRRGARPCRRRPRRRARRRTSSGARATGCCATSSCRWSRCWPPASAPASPPTSSTSPTSRAALREQVKQAAEEAYATVGHEFHLGSPKQLQALLFDELGLPKTKKIKTGYTTDADALQNLHRHAPGHRGAAAAPRDDPAAHGGGEAAAADGGRRRPHPHDVQADGRGDRPAVERQPEPAERPDPHRSRAARSARASSPGTATRRS